MGSARQSGISAHFSVGPTALAVGPHEPRASQSHGWPCPAALVTAEFLPERNQRTSRARACLVESLDPSRFPLAAGWHFCQRIAEPQSTGPIFASWRLSKKIVGISVILIDGTIKRFIEDQGGHKTIVYSGYAERVGHFIDEPGKMKFGGKVLTPIGKLEFRHKYMGKFFGVEKYGASWIQHYMLDEVPAKANVLFEPEVDDTDPKDIVVDTFAGPAE